MSIRLRFTLALTAVGQLAARSGSSGVRSKRRSAMQFALCPRIPELYATAFGTL